LQLLPINGLGLIVWIEEDRHMGQRRHSLFENFTVWR
jgi:hypothetical protein